MNRLKWWFRVVGGFYLLLTAMNLSGLFLGGNQMFADTLPAPMNTDALAVQAFSDAWLVFVFELGVLGAMALVASNAPVQNRIMAWTLIWAEVFRGIVGDVIWITRGYDAASYAIFIAIHLIIIVAGVMFVRQTQAE
ncbi:MAG: BphX family protein [Chloroflexi bacterium]|nr:BphX family protein [Chloroflexota bacterium]